MYIAKIVGRIIATQKEEKLVGTKLLIIQPLSIDGKPDGKHVIAIDTVGSGYGETVLIVTGSSARMAGNFSKTPVDAAIIGIIDSIKLD
ncbi:EutN/CcmL family microcompartment protein [Candidatus Dependentiae bacterium]|nr:EutN/CcmL family microcompartment protein [Candidatus Dependentiae bacterium]